jgi:hypothetical protein
MIAEYGAGAVIAAADQHFDWAKKELATLRSTRLFSARGISFISSRIESEHPGWKPGGPHLRFLCCDETLKAATPRRKSKCVSSRLRNSKAYMNAETISRMRWASPVRKTRTGWLP